MTSPAQLVFGAPLRLPGQLLPGVPPLNAVPTSSFVHDLQQSINTALPMPVLYHSAGSSYLPPALRSAKAVYVRVDAVRPPLSRPYDGPFPVLSRTDKTFVLLKGNKEWTVTVDRLKPAPTFPQAGPPPLPPSRPLDPCPLPPSSPIPDVGQLVPDVAPLVRPPAPAPDVPDVPAPEHVHPDPLHAPAPPVAPAGDPQFFRTRAGRISRPPDRYVAS